MNIFKFAATNFYCLATESSEDKTETEYSSIELPREADVEKIGED